MDFTQPGNCFSESYSAIRKCFPMSLNSMHATGALICAAAGKTLTAEKTKESLKILRSSKGMFSVFRDHLLIPIAVKMALSDDPEDYLSGLTCIYNEFLKHFHFGSEEILSASLSVFDNAAPGGQLEAVSETVKIYSDIRKLHPFLTEKKNLSFAALMAVYGKDCSAAVNEMEKCYEILKKAYRFGHDAVELACQVLAVNPDPAESKCAKLCEYHEYMKKNKTALEKGPQFGLIGLVINAGISKEEIVSDIKKLESYLKTLKGFGMLSMSTQERRMTEIALSVLGRISGSKAISSAVTSSVVSMIIDFELMIMIMVMTSIAVRRSIAASK